MRLSFGGGGTEIPPFVEIYGGATLSTTISVYARTYIEAQESKSIEIISADMSTMTKFTLKDFLNPDFSIIDTDLRIPFACLWYLFDREKIEISTGLLIKTSSDAPKGSGLGASSVLTVSILSALDEFFGLHWSKTKLAEVAFYIERKALNLSGGMQDHFAAAFGGCNFIEYHTNGKVSVEPLNLGDYFKRELESSLIGIYTGTSRESAHIIEHQQTAMANEDKITVFTLNQMKDLAFEMRRSFRKKDIVTLGEQLHDSWTLKKSTSELVTNLEIDDLYENALKLGAYGGKIAGAGGGGYLILLVPPENRGQIVSQLVKDDLVALPITLSNTGAEAWEVKG
jgi:D-glycero-alpha-D-manno-heptose-7-phosphate kinase